MSSIEPENRRPHRQDLEDTASIVAFTEGPDCSSSSDAVHPRGRRTYSGESRPLDDATQGTQSNRLPSPRELTPNQRMLLKEGLKALLVTPDASSRDSSSERSRKKSAKNFMRTQVVRVAYYIEKTLEKRWEEASFFSRLWYLFSPSYAKRMGTGLFVLKYGETPSVKNTGEKICFAVKDRRIIYRGPFPATWYTKLADKWIALRKRVSSCFVLLLAKIRRIWQAYFVWAR
ncbi:MAG: hypothetical protein AAGI90_02640 [Chlamydiota bacterium]